ncbi:acyl carrier protein [Streptomyces sp. SID3343]|uniref:acyl carrier protein n=1 Tax=Streptomyces sp. SID3343 TaxID=2690260 RepID=UPI00136DC890|nr:acyl carrier protein [Streptomyces sp. SID3343]MYW04634.1 acyl carrier protein [Streptomyces sp. SID3343]
MALSEREILDGLAEIINEETGLAVETIQLGKHFAEDLAIDESMMTVIAEHVGAKFRVTLRYADVERFKKVGDAVAYIQAAQG